MSRATLRLVSYRFRTTWRQRLGGLITLFLLVGLVGGLAMASVAAARRTASSFSTYWASTNPSDLVGATGVLNPTLGLNDGYNAPACGENQASPARDASAEPVGYRFSALATQWRAAECPQLLPPFGGQRLRQRRRSVLRPGQGDDGAGQESRPPARRRAHVELQRAPPRSGCTWGAFSRSGSTRTPRQRSRALVRPA